MAFPRVDRRRSNLLGKIREATPETAARYVQFHEHSSTGIPMRRTRAGRPSASMRLRRADIRRHETYTSIEARRATERNSALGSLKVGVVGVVRRATSRLVGQLMRRRAYIYSRALAARSRSLLSRGHATRLGRG